MSIRFDRLQVNTLLTITQLCYLVVLVFVFSACSLRAPEEVGPPGTKKIFLESQQGKIQVNAEIADTPEERQQGLMFRENLADGAGMLFIFEQEVPQNFWMKNTFIPLDILFADANGKIVSFVENMVPCESTGDDCPLYRSYRPAKYALEVPMGYIKQKGIRVGDSMVF